MLTQSEIDAKRIISVLIDITYHCDKKEMSTAEIINFGVKEITPIIAEERQRAKVLLDAANEILHLHLCEQEGLSSGKPTFQQWFEAVNKLSESINTYNKNKAIDDLEGEIWKKIPSHDHYEISNFGRVRKTSYLRPFTCGGVGYPQVQLFENDGCGQRRKGSGDKGKIRKAFIHRLIAEAFIPRVEGHPFINHKDGNKKNFSIDNLEWCTHSQNMQHAYDIGLRKPSGRHKKKKTRISQSKTTRP